MNLEKYYDPHRRLKLIAVMDELCDVRGVKESQKLLVKTVANDAPLCNLLKNELFPCVEHSVNVRVVCDV